MSGNSGIEMARRTSLFLTLAVKLKATMRSILFRILLFILFLPSGLKAQESGGPVKTKKGKGSFYFAWGYNKDWFSPSDLHFESKGKDNYSFTIHDVKANDLPKLDHIFDTDLSIPQYIYRFGYYFRNNKRFGIELSFDHAKYIMKQNQVAHVEGNIRGAYVDKDTILSPGFIRFEHTNGANFLMLSMLRRHQFLASKSEKHRLQGVIKPGIGIVIPQSDVSLFGHRQNNYYHIAGYIFGVEGSLRYEYGKHLFGETGFKGTFANYTNVLTVDDARANHHFFCLEWLFSIGFQVGI